MKRTKTLRLFIVWLLHVWCELIHQHQTNRLLFPFIVPRFLLLKTLVFRGHAESSTSSNKGNLYNITIFKNWLILLSIWPFSRIEESNEKATSTKFKWYIFVLTYIFLHSLVILSCFISYFIQIFNLQCVGSNSRANVDEVIRGGKDQIVSN
jgi:hypothetical protein